MKELKDQVMRWRYDVRPINGFNPVSTSSVAKVINDTLMLEAHVIMKYLDDARDLVSDVYVYGEHDPTELELFYVRESVLKLLEMVLNLCHNLMDFASLYEKEVLRKRIMETSGSIYNHIIEIRKSSDEYYTRGDKFKGVLPDGKMIEKVLWKKECIDIEDD